MYPDATAASNKGMEPMAHKTRRGSCPGRWRTRKSCDPLRFDLWPPSAASTPQGAGDYFVFIEGVVEMAPDFRQIPAAKARNRHFSVRCPPRREAAPAVEGLLRARSQKPRYGFCS